MYIYKVTHTPTGQYYIGISNKHKDSFNDTIDIDPMKFFNLYESNGYGQNKMVVCAKSLVAFSDEQETIERRVSEFAKSRENDPNFLGLKLKTKAEEEASLKVKPTKTQSTPTTVTE